MDRRALIFALAIAVSPASAQPAKRFPQPVRAGDLVGRRVLQPTESQPVLGRVAFVTHGADGSLAMVMRVGGLLGFGTRDVAVPLEAVALLGEYVALMDLTPKQLRALPAASGALVPLAGDTVIRMGVVRPFH